MNKVEFINEIAKRTQKEKKVVNEIIEKGLEVIGEKLAQGEEVRLAGLGTFCTTVRNARTVRNPQTGEEIHVSECKAPKFKAAKALKDKVKGVAQETV